MKTKIQKWGNSLGLRIPKPIADQLSLLEGSEVRISSNGERMVIEKAKHYRLSDLVAAIDENNVHGEVDAGKAKGAEIW